MNNFRRSNHSKNDRSSFAVQSDPNDFAQLNSDLNSTGYNIKSVTPKIFNQSPSIEPKDNINNTKTVQDPEK